MQSKVWARTRYSGHDLAHLQLVENGGLASIVQAQDEHAHLLIAKDGGDDLGDESSHAAPPTDVNASPMRPSKNQKMLSTYPHICPPAFRAQSKSLLGISLVPRNHGHR